MGRDKVVADVGGAPLAARAVAALVGAGVDPVVCVGGDAPRLGAAGLAVVPDRHPGEGPLGGVLTALHDVGVDSELLVVLAGDLADPDPLAVALVLDRLASRPGADLVVPVVGGRPQWLHAAWRRSSARAALGHAFATGMRSIHEAVSALRVVEVAIAGGGAPGRAADLDPRRFDDVDTPADLARLVHPDRDDELA